MVEAGILDEDDRVELIEGELIDMAPISSKHAFVVSRLAEFFYAFHQPRNIVMNKSALLSIAIACMTVLTCAHAMDGHNGIQFDMSQKEVEAKGFVCNPPKEKIDHILSLCAHMDMTGVAFGDPTKDYSIVIGPSGKVDQISAVFANTANVSDYVSLSAKIVNFFPNKHEPSTMHESHVMTDEWRAHDNSAAVLTYLRACHSPQLSPKTDLTQC